MYILVNKCQKLLILKAWIKYPWCSANQIHHNKQNGRRQVFGTSNFEGEFCVDKGWKLWQNNRERCMKLIALRESLSEGIVVPVEGNTNILNWAVTSQTQSQTLIRYSDNSVSVSEATLPLPLHSHSHPTHWPFHSLMGMASRRTLALTRAIKYWAWSQRSPAN